MRSLVLSSVRDRPFGVRLAGGVLAAIAVLAMGACSSGAGGPTSSASAAESSVAQNHNDADVTFSRDMIPHHRQAVEMAKLVPTRASDPRVTELATEIAAAQTPEIDELSSRLRSWSQPVPSGSGMGGGSMNQGSGSSMNGMMSAGDMSELANLRGAAFDDKWCSMMIEHHTGAVQMARTEIANGTDQASKKLAQNIIATQQSEIATMQKILAG